MIPPFGPAITPAHFGFRSAVEHFFGKVKAGCPKVKSASPTPSLRGALATKQSSLSSLAPGLLRGACHRARIRATRWRAMTGLMTPIWLEIIAARSLPQTTNAIARLYGAAPLVA
jgi:hypothetical protein